jgi:hypothetical protein
MPAVAKPPNCPIFLTPQSFPAYDESMAENRSSLSIIGRIARRTVASAIVAALGLQSVATAQAQPGGGAPTYQRKGSFAGDWGGGHDKWRQRPMPQFSSQTSAGSFQRPYPYHLDYYRARWGGSYAPYFGNLYGPPNFFFGSPFFGGVNPWWGFGGLPFAGYGTGFNGFGGGGFGGPGFGGVGFEGAGFGGAGFGGGPFSGGTPYGPWQGQVAPGTAPFGGPFEGGPMQGPAPGY